MTTYKFEKKEDICKILLLNNVKRLNDAFEIVVKDINKHRTKNFIDGSDFVILEMHVFPLTFQNDSPITLHRNDSKLYYVYFVNVKNENDEHFSHLIENLHENDRILITNGVLSKNCVKFQTVRWNLTVRSENNSSVFLFKFSGIHSAMSDLLIQKNLSSISRPGVYLLFGRVLKIIKYPNENCMLLRILCCDKSCVKTLKYPHSEKELKSDLTEGNEFDFFSNKVDILVENPGEEFNSLLLNQRIYLNNVKVNISNESNIFALKVMGVKSNLISDPIETSNVKSLRPPTKHFPIPDELKPAVRSSKAKQTKMSPIKKPAPVAHQHQDRPVLSSDLSSDDYVHILPSKDLPTVGKKHTKICVFDEFNNLDSNTLVGRKNKMNNNYVQSKDNFSVKNINAKLQMDPGPKRSNCNLINKQVSIENGSSPEKSSEGSCSPPFFQTASATTTQTLPSNKSKPELKQLQNNSKSPTQCLGPCRLVRIEPNVFCTDEIVSGYCAKNCFSFFSISDLKKNSSSNDYVCPNCADIVHLTFYFEMNFLYGKNYSRAVEVCCFNEDAQHVLKKLTKRNISVEGYLSNDDDRKLITDTIKMFINNKTKVNIIISNSPIDETKFLKSIDTKYVVTSFD